MKKHPFGHGRIEKIATLIIAFLLIFACIDLIKISISRIIHPEIINPNIFCNSFYVFFHFFLKNG
jgi:divalent metal cation (Fe/Co/Zn/Cd) transporter